MRFPLIYLCHGLGALGYGVFGEFARENETSGSLDFASGDC